MGGKSTDTGSTGYTGGLTPYANNLFGAGSTDTSSGPSSMQNLGQQIMQASNKFSAQQGGPEEQAMAGIGNALVNKFTQPAQVDTTTPNLFGGSTPTYAPPNPFATNNINNTNTGIVGSAPISFQSFQPGLTLPANSAGTGATVPKLFG